MLAGSKPVADRFEAKFHTLSGSKRVGDRLQPSFEPASVMEFGHEPASSC